MTWLAEMYATLAPGIFAGVLNMVWCTLPVAAPLSRPIDGGRTWRGRRLLGDNKTWKGLAGMVVLGMVCTVVWGWVCDALPRLEPLTYFYRSHDNTLAYNVVVGLAIGAAYALFELPNSFLKRRRGVAPGRGPGSGWGAGFVVLDQIDSVVGMVLVVACVYPMSLGFFGLYVLVGGVTHVALNLALFAARLRRNPL
ncbi:MAG: CDP-archaeol synthase [Micrococcales bacterium]|nr:CDP-archaeol synthase [Micrococcales bacterium]